MGKSTLVANMGIALAESGHRVVLFDADLALANLDVILGLKSDVRVQHTLEGKASLTDAMVEGPAGIKVITGDSGLGKMIRLSRKRLATFLEEQVRDLASSTDFLIFDASAGTDAKVITFARAADEVVLIVTPDPASIVDAYATAKVLFRSKPDAKVRVIVNMAESHDQALKVFRAVESAISRFLGKAIYFSGGVAFDPKVSLYNRAKSAVMLSAPTFHVSRDMRKVAGLIAAAPLSSPPQVVKTRRAA